MALHSNHQNSLRTFLPHSKVEILHQNNNNKSTMQPPPFPENKTNQKTASNPGHILGMKSNTASRGCRAWRDPLERGANCTKKSAPQRELKTSGKRWGRNEATLLLDVTELSSPYHTGLLLSFLVRLSPFPSFFLGGGGVAELCSQWGSCPAIPAAPPPAQG